MKITVESEVTDMSAVAWTPELSKFVRAAKKSDSVQPTSMISSIEMSAVTKIFNDAKKNVAKVGALSWWG